MEQRIDALEKRLARFRGGKSRTDDDVTGDDDEATNDLVEAPPVQQDISNKILAFQSEIRRLEKVVHFMSWSHPIITNEIVCRNETR